jgi:hypothetical protein
MIKSDNEIKSDWNALEEESLKDICERVKSYERNIQDYLADVVAALCDLDLSDMMTKDDRVHCNHARWLFWYAYRHMTNDTFEHLSQITDRYGRKFAHQSINSAVNKMSVLIADNTIWTKRWVVIRRIIKARDQSIEIDFGQIKQVPTDKVTISIPQDLKSKIEINYI